MTNKIQEIQSEIKRELSNKAVLDALISTTFKGLAVPQVYLALQEGLIRGFTFQDFLEKKVYAIPFKDGYTLITSIDYSRAIGARSGVVGKDAPTFTEQDGKIVSCTVTVKKKIGDYIGDFTATVYFDEYYKAGKNGYPSLWDQKKHTMIAKVAEMHALRMACPEELDKAYVEEEMSDGTVIEMIDTVQQEEINNCKTTNELNTYYQANKGKGKAFDKAIIARKKELEADSTQGSDPTESRVVPDEVA